MEEQKGKRVLNIELDEDVKKVSITGTNAEEKVVMRQELDEDELNKVAAGILYCPDKCSRLLPPEYADYFAGLESR